MQLYKVKKLLSVVKIINLYFWKTKIGPLFAILLPLGFMLIYYAICSSTKNYEYFKIAMPTFISMSIMPLSILTIPAMNIEFRSSIILRKIKTNNINATEYSIISYLYYIVLNTVAVSITIGMYTLFMLNHGGGFEYINIGSLIYAILTLVLVSISLGTFLSIIIKNALNSQIIGFALIMFCLLLSGQLINIYIVPRVDILKNIAYIFPLVYPLSDLNIATLFSNDNNVLNFDNDWIYQEFRSNGSIAQYLIYSAQQKIIFAIVPWAWLIALQAASSWSFRWVVR